MHARTCACVFSYRSPSTSRYWYTLPLALPLPFLSPALVPPNTSLYRSLLPSIPPWFEIFPWPNLTATARCFALTSDRRDASPWLERNATLISDAQWMLQDDAYDCTEMKAGEDRPRRDARHLHKHTQTHALRCIRCPSQAPARPHHTPSWQSLPRHGVTLFYPGK